MSSVTAAPVPLAGRAARQSERRRRVKDIALEVFTRPGRRRDDIQEIAKRARVGKATVYRDFGSRNGLLMEIAEEGIEALLGAVVAAVSGADHPRVAVGDAVHTALAFFEERPQLARLLLLEAGESREPIVACYLDRYARSRPAAQPLFEAHPPPAELRDRPTEELVDLVMYLITGRLFYWVLTGQQEGLVRDAPTITRAYLGGVMQGEGSRP